MAGREISLNRYGWRRDKPDFRDLKYAVPQHLTSLPKEIDLRPECPVPYDQLNLGCCSGFAITGHLHYNLIKQDPKKAFQPSPLFIYYNERVLENSVSEDSGAELRDGIKSLVRWGFCAETYCPYLVSKFKNKPSSLAYKQALPHRITQYTRISQNLDQMKACLADKSPFVFGFMVYESFESDEVAKTGIMKMPEIGEKDLGGHAVLAVGYNDVESKFIVRNSWGVKWGIGGYFKMPYDYITNSDLAADFWTIHYTP